MTYFDVFDLPKILNLDLNALEKSFHELSRRYHPDYFATAAPEEKGRALRMTALLNDAYRTLRRPIERVEYLTNIEGFKPDGSRVPKAFLMEVFEINEQIEDIRGGGATEAQIDSIRGAIRKKSSQFEAELDEATREWDRLVIEGAPDAMKKQQLAKLTEILSESSYIRNLERELEEKL
jgi:molecular chaperone HscB